MVSPGIREVDLKMKTIEVYEFPMIFSIYTKTVTNN